MRSLGRFFTAIGGAGILLAVTGGWVFVAAAVILTARLLAFEPDGATVLQWTAAGTFIVMNVAVLTAILIVRHHPD